MIQINHHQVTSLIEILRKWHPDATTPLNHTTDYELLFAVILSAQATDVSVNKVTPALFEKYPTLEAFANADPSEVNELVHTINYHNAKSANIVKAAQKIMKEFNGKVPSEMGQMTSLPGVGRKTANVVISEWFARRGLAEPVGVVVDTHVLRVSKRHGLTDQITPEKVEIDLMEALPKSEWIDTPLRLIFLGRQICTARNQTDSDCPLHQIYFQG